MREMAIAGGITVEVMGGVTVGRMTFEGMITFREGDGEAITA